MRAANISSYEAPNAPSTSSDTNYIDLRVQQLKKPFKIIVFNGEINVRSLIFVWWWCIFTWLKLNWWRNYLVKIRKGANIYSRSIKFRLDNIRIPQFVPMVNNENSSKSRLTHNRSEFKWFCKKLSIFLIYYRSCKKLTRPSFKAFAFWICIWIAFKMFPFTPIVFIIPLAPIIIRIFAAGAKI